MKKISEILNGIDYKLVQGDANTNIINLECHSSKVTVSTLFFSIIGSDNDGHNYIDHSISLGAIAVVCEKIPISINSQVTYIQVNNSSRALAVAAANFFNHPSKKIKLIGVTGTNGKTSTVY